jgi:hypothetical protein
VKVHVAAEGAVKLLKVPLAAIPTESPPELCDTIFHNVLLGCY